MKFRINNKIHEAKKVMRQDHGVTFFQIKKGKDFFTICHHEIDNDFILYDENKKIDGAPVQTRLQKFDNGMVGCDFCHDLPGAIIGTESFDLGLQNWNNSIGAA